VESDGRYRYCEGWANSDATRGAIIQHAWLTSNGDDAIDVTWKQPGTAYFGVVLSREQFNAALEAAYLDEDVLSYLDWLTS
jgi:hypothetical protein